MVDYNMTPIDVWGSFAGGMQIGGALRDRRQQEERRQAYGDAYQSGGWGGVAETAGGMGDLESAEGAQGQVYRGQEAKAAVEEDLRARALESATVLQRLYRSLDGLDEATRAERIAQMRPQLSQFVDETALNNVDTSDAGWAALGQSLDAAVGQFQEYEQVINAGNGRVIGVRRDGSQEVISEGQPEWQTNGTRPYRVNQESGAVEYGQGEIPHRPTGAGAQGPTPGAPYSGSGLRWTEDASGLEPIPGGPRDPSQRTTRAFGPDQRARVAITLDSALEAAQQLEQAERQAVERQGTHDFDTPFGQDYGARILEAIPFDGGSIARAVGGTDYQLYTRASSAFEAAMLPILSGAAVTESEAQRTVRAALPRMNDSQETLAAKARMRRQMLNGGALIGGRPLPFPEDAVPDWANAAQQGGGSAAPVAQEEDPLPGDIQDGFEFLGGDPADPNNWEPVR